MARVEVSQGRWALLAGFLIGIWAALRTAVALLEYTTRFSPAVNLSIVMEVLIILTLFTAAAGIMMRIRVGWYAGLTASALVFFSNLSNAGFQPARDIPVAMVFFLVLYGWYRTDTVFE